MGLDRPSACRRYVLVVMKHIATDHRRRPGVKNDYRWCPAHKGAPVNEQADQGALPAARARRSRCGTPVAKEVLTISRTKTAAPQSLAHLNRTIEVVKWQNASRGGGAESKITGKNYSRADSCSHARCRARTQQTQISGWLQGSAS